MGTQDNPSDCVTPRKQGKRVTPVMIRRYGERAGELLLLGGILGGLFGSLTGHLEFGALMGVLLGGAVLPVAMLQESPHWPNRWYFPLACLGVIGGWLLSRLPQFDPVLLSSQQNQQTTLVLLSSQATILAGALVLILSVSIAAAALAVEFTWRVLGLVLDWWLLWYAVPYAAGFLLPLILLTGGTPVEEVGIVLAFLGLCIMLLGAYVVELRNRLSLPTLIKRLQSMALQPIARAARDALKVRDAPAEKKAWLRLEKNEGLNALEGIGYKAIDAHDSDALSVTLTALAEIAEILWQMDWTVIRPGLQDWGEDEHVSERPAVFVMDKMAGFGRYLYRHRDPSAPHVIIDALRDLGKCAVAAGKGEIAVETALGLASVGRRAAEQHLRHATDRAVKGLKDIGDQGGAANLKGYVTAKKRKEDVAFAADRGIVEVLAEYHYYNPTGNLKDFGKLISLDRIDAVIGEIKAVDAPWIHAFREAFAQGLERNWVPLSTNASYGRYHFVAALLRCLANGIEARPGGARNTS